MPGLFISLDGVDGGGKSTQAAMLCGWYQQRGQETVSLRDPGGTQLGEALREILLHREEIPLCMTAEMLLYMASRAQLVSEVIRPALEQGKVVISDRYLPANVVYQGCAGGLPVDSLWQVGEIASGGLVPDLTIVMDLEVYIAMQRLGSHLDRLESRGADYMHRVRDGFLLEAKRLGNQAAVVDASQTVDAIHQEIIATVLAFEHI